MYKVINAGVDLNATLNHRMYVKIDDEYKLEEAGNIIGKDVAYKNNAEWNTEDYQFILPELKVKWLGVIVTDTYEADKVCMKGWLLYFGICIAKNFDCKINKQIDAYISSLNKKIPEWVWKLSKNQSQLLVTSIMSEFKDNIVNSLELANNILRLILHTGWNGKYINKQIIINKNEYDYSFREESVYDFKGAVYCLQVPSEIFMVKRNGKPVWTGNSRGSNGPIVMLTRQCSEGRARNGGLRLGEMERDCFIGHGSSLFLKEKMLDSADNYRIFICKTCGLIANVNPDKNIYKCNYCKNASDIVQIRIPYAFKLLSQELYTMNVLMRFVSN
jgi:hypothetical protein